MKKKLPKPLIITLITATILAVLYFFRNVIGMLIWGIACIGLAITFAISGLLEPPPPPPQIEYADFPIKLVYEIDGTEYEITETLMCQYDGWESTGGGLTKERIWKFVNGDGSKYFTIYDDGETEIYCEYLSAGAYMGDPKPRDYNPKLGIYATTEQISHRTMSTRELFEEFGITKIRFYPPDPIENNFSYLNYFR